MIIKKKLLIKAAFFFLLLNTVHAQQISKVYKADQLIERISKPDTIYVVNFWATWCKPCVKELPAFDSLSVQAPAANFKVLLVNLDFLELKSKVNDFLKNKQIKPECVLLDEVNGNDYIDRISKDWSGSIPATIIWRGDQHLLIDHPVNLSQLQAALTAFLKSH